MPALNPCFRDLAGQSAVLAAYDDALALWPAPVEHLDLLTTFGTTHALVCGDPTAPPVVLLHGAGCSAAMWHAMARTLAPRFRCFALDTIGDVGRSVARSAPRSLDDYVAWLAEVLGALALDAPRVVTHSYGGWIALGFASAHPERVRRLVTLAPAASFARVRLRFIARTAPAFYIRHPALIRRMLHGISSRGPELCAHPMGRLCARIARHGRPISVFPSKLPRARLRRVRAPTLVLVGERELLYRPATVQRVVANTLPRGRFELVRGAGHALTFDAAEDVGRRALAFLDDER